MIETALNASFNLKAIYGDPKGTAAKAYGISIYVNIYTGARFCKVRFK